MVSVKKMAEQCEQILKKGNKMKGNTPTHTHIHTHTRTVNMIMFVSWDAVSLLSVDAF